MRIPFQIDPELPLEVTVGDRIDLPIAVVNATDNEARIELSLVADASLKPTSVEPLIVDIPAKERCRETIPLNVIASSAEHDANITIRGKGSQVADSIRRTVHVSPNGYPATQSLAGRIRTKEKVLLSLPGNLVDGSLAVTVRAYPSPIADVMSGIESLLREPHGCFEQTSATNYPNTMALLYLQENQTAKPEVSRQALSMLERGYEKLTSFECDCQGYEWFGVDPGHEALSAFGLMQFVDMSKVMDVSETMIARTRQWLMSRRDGKGGFGSTQATVLALKALVSIARNHSNEVVGGSLQVLHDGQVIGEADLPNDSRSGGTIEIPGLGEKLLSGSSGPQEIKLELVASGVKSLSYSIDVAYHAMSPSSDNRCPLRLTTKFLGKNQAGGVIASGDNADVEVHLQNTSNEGLPMTVAIVGLPGGVVPRITQLDEMQDAGVFDYYELRGREVVLYWRTIQPAENKVINLSCTATIPGQYTGPASRTYLYYTAEQKQWTAPLKIEIK